MMCKLFRFLLIGSFLSSCACVSGSQANRAKSSTPASAVNQQQTRATTPSFSCGSVYEVSEAYLLGCQKDEDCGIVAADCCGCNAAGAQTAIYRKYFSHAQACRAEKCAATLCAQMISTDKSCRLNETLCKNGKCELN